MLEVYIPYLHFPYEPQFTLKPALKFCATDAFMSPVVLTYILLVNMAQGTIEKR